MHKVCSKNAFKTKREIDRKTTLYSYCTDFGLTLMKKKKMVLINKIYGNSINMLFEVQNKKTNNQNDQNLQYVTAKDLSKSANQKGC